jgi:hypothetical protein
MEEHNHEEALESDFEKRLLEMEISAANWINSQLSSLNDAQKVEYDRRLSVAYSLIEPYRLSKKEQASARASSKVVGEVFGYFFLGFIILVIAKSVFEWVFPELDWFSSLSTSPWAAAVLVIAVLGAIKSSADAEWECKRCEQLRILYQQKWIALGLDWRLLVELADWKESEENYDEAKVRWDDLRASNKHKVSKAKLNWELSGDLLRRFNLDFYPKLKDYEENRIPDWDSLAAEIPRSDNS